MSEYEKNLMSSATKTKFVVHFEFTEVVDIEVSEFMRIIRFLTTDALERYTGAGGQLYLGVDKPDLGAK